jgi:molybdopterin-guanine dinucleotide biosynthesis protein A
VIPAAIVLAGGASKRFGADKLAADLRGRPVLEHALRAVATVADPIVVVIGPDDPLPFLPPELGAEVLLARDVVAHQGPLAGLAVGMAVLAALPARATLAAPEVAIVVAGDMPTLVPAVLRLLADTLAANPPLAAIALEADPLTPLPAAIRLAVAGPAAAELLAADRRSLLGLLAALDAATLPAAAWRAHDPDAATLRDIDTRDDLLGLGSLDPER